MADQRIVDLPIKTDTGISLADYLLGIDSAEGYQMLISDLAKKIVETYTGSSLAGSSQTLKSVIDNDLVRKSGDIVAGSLDLKSTNIAVDTPPSIDTQGVGRVRFYDSDNNYMGRVSPNMFADGKQAIYLQCTREISGNNVSNHLALIVDASGNKTVTVSDPAAWRSGLNVVNKSGDTIIGDLIVKNDTANDYIIRNDVRFTRGTPPSSNTAKGGFVVCDRDGADIGRLGAYFWSNGAEGVRIGTARTLTSGAVGNYIHLGIDGEGNRVVAISAVSEWITALGLTRTAYTVTKNSSFNSDSWDVKVYKFKDFAIIRFYIHVPALTAQTWYTMATLPTQVVPSETQRWTVAGISTGQFLIELNTSRSLRIYSNSASGIQYCGGALVVLTTT